LQSAVPAQAGIRPCASHESWIAAFAGMTK